MEVTGQKPRLTVYSERNSVDIYNEVNQLFQKPKVELTDSQQHEVTEFAEGVFKGEAGAFKNEAGRNLEELAGVSLQSSVQEFYLGYFLTDKGKEDLIRMGIKGQSVDEIKFGLTDIRKVTFSVDAKTRKKIAKNSLNWRKNEVVEALETHQDLDAAHIDDVRVTINYKPERLLDVVADLAAHDRFYRLVKINLKKQPDSDVKTAKMLELEMNLATANSMLGGMYDEMLNLGRQLLGRSDQLGPTDTLRLKRIEDLTPVIHRALTRNVGQAPSSPDSTEKFEESLARRMDYLAQGVAWDKNGKISSISPEVVDFAIEVVRQNETQETAEKAVFDQAVIEKLKSAKWDANKFKQFCERVLSQWEILSAQPGDWAQATEQDGAAADDKWRVIIDPQTDTLKVNRIKKLLHVPESFNRNLIKSLTVAAHELTHLAQAESDSVTAKTIPLAKANGRRTSAMREGGAVDQEAKAYAMLGNHRPTRTAYLAAMQVKLDGGNPVQVARAFYNAYEDEANLSDDEKQENRVTAADRALRLYRNGGYSSQPLTYMEGELTKQAISQMSPDLVEPVMIAGASFSIRDAVRLHNAGLYKVPTATRFHPAQDVIKIFQQEYLGEVLAA